MIVFYSTDCPKCKVLKSKLDGKWVIYEERNDVDEMLKKGYMSAPVLEIDGKAYNFKEALDWVNGM